MRFEDSVLIGREVVVDDMLVIRTRFQLLTSAGPPVCNLQVLRGFTTFGDLGVLKGISYQGHVHICRLEVLMHGANTPLIQSFNDMKL